MSLSAARVVAASIAMTWVPETATTEETDDYRLVRLPDYFDPPLRLLRFSPAGPVEPALAAVLDRARQFGLPELQWTVQPGQPARDRRTCSTRAARRSPRRWTCSRST